MEEKTTSVSKPALINGIILGLALVIHSILLFIMDLSLNKYLSSISYLIIFVILIYATKSYRDNKLNGNISYGNALGYAMLIILIAAIIQTVYTYIYLTVIDTEYINKALTLAEEKLMEKGNVPDDQIEMQILIQRKIMQPVILSILTLIGTAFAGFIIALITSAILKKNQDPFQEAMQDIDE